ncbi:MAG: glutamate racemase [Zoogloeaceae bacterium]|jgi:glutamate racemase|nr:glutamate racemase [Zoogloeaceae bacterium]
MSLSGSLLNAFPLSQPIGVFDSGLGGLTVLQALRARLPGEDFIYFADTHHLPYGDKSESFIQARSKAIATALTERGAKAVVVACNTATAAAAELIRAAIPKPVVALEPAVKPAAALTQSGVLGVLATTRTLVSRRFAHLVETYAHHLFVLPQACPGLAEAIEAEGPHSASVERLLDIYVPPLARAGADVVVLGCTHYPWVKAGIAARLPSGVTLVDTGEAVARQVERRLMRESGLGGRGQLQLMTSGDPVHVRNTIARLCGVSMHVTHWDIR